MPGSEEKVTQGREELLVPHLTPDALKFIEKIKKRKLITQSNVTDITSQKLSSIFKESQHQKLFLRVYEYLSPWHKANLVKLMRSCLKEPDPEKSASMLGGILFELEMIGQIKAEELERFVPELQGSLGAIHYYSHKTRKPRYDPYFIPDLLLPRRGKKPLALEMKFSSSLTSGSKPVEQCAKYQEAVRQKRISSATIILDGLVNPNFTAWAEEPDPFPGIEMLSRVRLPSGHKYILPFKPLKPRKDGKPKTGLLYRREEIGFLKDHADSDEVPYSMAQLFSHHPAWYQALKTSVQPDRTDRQIYILLRQVDRVIINALKNIELSKVSLKKFMLDPTWTTYADGTEDKGAPMRRVWLKLVETYYPTSEAVNILKAGLILH